MPRVLVVSSDRALASELELALGPSFEVHSAVSQDAATALLDAHRYDCVVSDVRPVSTSGHVRADVVLSSEHSERGDDALVVTHREQLAKAVRRTVN